MPSRPTSIIILLLLALTVKFAVAQETSPSLSEEGYRAILRNDPNNRAAHMALGDLLQSQGRWGEATQEYLAGSPGSAVYRINAGGPYTDSRGSAWSGDQGADRGGVYRNSRSVQGTSDPRLFQAQHCHRNPFQYNLPVPNGTYRVNLYFAEIFPGRIIFDSTQGVGRRFFDVTINDRNPWGRIDVYFQVGGFTALVKSAITQVSDGMLRIRFITAYPSLPNNWPVVNAMEVVALSEAYDGSLQARASAAVGASRGSAASAGPAEATSSERARAAGAQLADEAAPTGLYSLEQEISFNVLDTVVLNSATGQVSLVGHYDPRYAGRPIPYLDHLAAFLDYPTPQFSLHWTPESQPRIEALFRQMDNNEEVRRMAAQWGQVLDANGKVTASGRWLLPLWGIQPTLNGKSPGHLGVTVASDSNDVEVKQVEPGSPAAKAGLHPGDHIMTFAGQQYTLAEEFGRAVRFGGARNTVKMMALIAPNRSYQTIDITLAEGRGDPWADLDRYDIIARILRASGKENAAKIVDIAGLFARYPRASADQQENFTLSLLFATNTMTLRDQILERVRRGEITQAQGATQLFRAVLAAMDLAFGLASQPIARSFDSNLPRLGAAGAFTEAMGEVDRQLRPMMENAIHSFWLRQAEIQVPPDLIEAAAHTRLEVTPEFLGLDPHSQLARVMYESDYVFKKLINAPEMRRVIPRYQTHFAFERAHPGSNFRPTSANHLWISIQSIEMAQSAPGNTLHFGDVRMRINIREKDTFGHDLPATPGSYEELLTSLYDDFSAQLPILHELRECAKLAGAAAWLHKRKPELRLPEAGRTVWQGPSRVPGIVFLTWAPNPAPGAVSATLMAMGGVSLVLPGLEPFPNGTPKGAILEGANVPLEASVVDLSHSSLVAPPSPSATVSAASVVPSPSEYVTTAMREYLRPMTEVPVPRPVGWVATATRGVTSERKIERAISFLGNAGDQEAAESIELQRELENCRQTAFRLAEAERAINILTGQSPSRQAEFSEMASDLEQAQDQFMETSLDILTEGLLDTHEQLREMNLTSRAGALGEVAGNMVDAENALSELEKKVTDLRKAWQTARSDDRSQQMQYLIDTARHLVSHLDPSATGPLAEALRPVAKTLRYANKLKDVHRLGSSLGTLYSATQQMRSLEARTAQESAALRDKLLPLQRSLSDELDRCTKQPAVQKAMKAAETSGHR